MRRRALPLLAIVLMLCPNARAARSTLTVWGPGVEKSTDSFGFDALCKEFERREGVRILRLSMGAGGMDPQKLSTAIAGGVAPDLVKQDRFTVGDWASRGAFQPLDDLIARDQSLPDGIRERDFYPATWNEAVYQGRVYAIPNITDDRCLFVNREVLRRAGYTQAPRTWSELREMAARLTKHDKRGNITQVGFLPNFGNVWLYMYSWQNGGEFMSEDGRVCTMANPLTAEALQYMVDLMNDAGGWNKIAAFTSGFRGETMDPFLTGKVAMKVDGNWFTNAIARYKPTLDFEVVPTPVPDDRYHQRGRFAGQPRFITWSGGFSWVIPRGVRGEQRELAWRFIKFETSLEGQRLAWGAQRDAYRALGRPVVPEMRANRIVNEAILEEFTARRPRIQAGMKVFSEMMPHSRFRPVTFVGQRLWDEHVRAYDLAARGIMSPMAALEQGQEAVQKELDTTFARERYRELPGGAYVVLTILAAAMVVGAVAWVLLRARRQGRIERQETLAAYLFAAPWIVGFVVFTLGPILASILLSFTEYDVLHAPRWVAGDNYVNLLNPEQGWPILWISFRNVAFMSVYGIPLGMAAGLGIALLLNARVRGMHYYRTAYYVPSIAPVVANAILWLWLLNPQYGLINHAWNATLTQWFGWSAPNWMADPGWSKPAFIVMGLWGAGGGMILWLAGLQGIPQHLYEAAELDGAGPWRQFWNVMLPMLSPTIFFLAVMGIIGTLQIFEIAYIMGGQPLGSPADSTMMPVVLLFQYAFQYFKMGYASALAWILFVVILAITLAQLHFSRRWVHYGE